MNSNVMNRLSYGLFVVTAREDSRDNGCVSNTVIQVTTSPNRIVVSLNKNNLTHDMILRTGRFDVSVLSKNADFGIYQHWGMQSGHQVEKVPDPIPFSFCRSENGLIYLPDGTSAFLSAQVVSSTDLGTHTLFLADVTDGAVLSEDESVTYLYYLQNIKPAPAGTRKKGFVCRVCGYIYEGDFLPSDFICPVCKHPAADFDPL